MKYWILIFFILVSTPIAEAYSTDSSSVVYPRYFDPEAISSASEDYNFKEEDENSAWNKIMRAISEFLYRSMTSESETGTYVYIVLGIVILLIAAFFIMKSQKIWLFAQGNDKSQDFEAEVLKENIHEMDFDKLISEAENKERFNIAIRLHFLKLLKQLNDENKINWEANKTNREYYYEIKNTSLREEYEKVSDYFERVWYGDYEITEIIYKRIKPAFVAVNKKASA